MAAGSTYTPLATQTLASAAASVTFSSISGAYKDLVIIADVLGAGTADLDINFNSDTASNYSKTFLSGNGSTASSGRYASQAYVRLTQNVFLTSDRCNFIIFLQNYSNSTTYKSLLWRANAAGQGAEASVGLWRSTSAISTIVLSGTGANLDAGSTFTLYGIAAA